MKVVINTCFGGFSLSRAAVKRIAELQGRKCYFFKPDTTIYDLETYLPVKDAPEGKRDLMWSAFDIPNPGETFKRDKPWPQMSLDERKAWNDLYRRHELDTRPNDRSDPTLIQVVEELGEAANGACAKLKIVEIPDDVDYIIEEYDGTEHIAERHRTWS